MRLCHRAVVQHRRTIPPQGAFSALASERDFSNIASAISRASSRRFTTSVLHVFRAALGSFPHSAPAAFVSMSMSWPVLRLFLSADFMASLKATFACAFGDLKTSS